MCTKLGRNLSLPLCLTSLVPSPVLALLPPKHYRWEAMTLSGPLFPLQKPATCPAGAGLLLRLLDLCSPLMTTPWVENAAPLVALVKILWLVGLLT